MLVLKVVVYSNLLMEDLHGLQLILVPPQDTIFSLSLEIQIQFMLQELAFMFPQTEA